MDMAFLGVFYVCLALDTQLTALISVVASLLHLQGERRIHLMWKHPNSFKTCACGICKISATNELGVEGTCFTKIFPVHFIEDVRISS